MRHEEHIGFAVKSLNNQIRRAVDQIALGCGLTGMQGWIIGYLYNRGDREVFQRDLERDFDIRRSTVTGVLQLMERDGLIRRDPVGQDARLKRLTLTPKAMELHDQIDAQLLELERRMRQNLSEQELHAFFHTIETMERNLG